MAGEVSGFGDSGPPGGMDAGRPADAAVGGESLTDLAVRLGEATDDAQLRFVGAITTTEDGDNELVLWLGPRESVTVRDQLAESDLYDPTAKLTWVTHRHRRREDLYRVDHFDEHPSVMSLEPSGVPGLFRPELAKPRDIVRLTAKVEHGNPERPLGWVQKLLGGFTIQRT